jgi:hypothetical protein
MAVDDDLCLLVHAAGIETDMAFDLDGDRRIESAGDRMLAHRMGDHPMALIGIGGKAHETRIDAADAFLLKVKLDQA